MGLTHQHTTHSITAKDKMKNIKSAYKKFIKTANKNGLKVEFTEDQFIDCLKSLTVYVCSPTKG